MISVIVPVYNNVKYLETCILSICAQTYSNLEIIAVDDGSTDGSAELIDRLAEIDCRIKVIHKENGGVSSARNTGITKAEGDYITFVDSDDTIEPDMYEMLLATIKQYNAEIAHCSYSRLIGSEKISIGGSGRVFTQTAEEAQFSLLNGEMFTGSLCTKLFCRELFETVRLREDLKINEDVLAVFQLFQQASKIIFCDVCKYNYRTSETSSCARTDSIKKAQDCIKASEIMRDEACDDVIKMLSAKRLLGCYFRYYRVMAFRSYGKTKVERTRISSEISILMKSGVRPSWKKLLEYHLIRAIPHCYIVVYSIYDRIRKPNWDI